MQRNVTALFGPNQLHAECFVGLGHAGHLGASLGVIELTVALHYVFNCPDDKVSLNIKQLLLRREGSTESLSCQKGLVVVWLRSLEE